MAKHTPGEWKYDPTEPRVLSQNLRGPDGGVVADIRFPRPVDFVSLKDSDAIQDANGRLIAAAPRMLELLREVVATKIELTPTVRFKEWYALCEKIDRLLEEVEGE
jgi:hypothetical protein